jgi:hypothetical protein
MKSAPSLNFYDMKAKKKFQSTNYKIVTKNGRRFATTKAPSGCASWVTVKKTK